MSNKITILKQAVGFISGLGVAQVINGIVANNTPSETTYQKTTAKIGGYVIGLVVGEMVQNHTDKMIDNAVTWYRNVKDKNKAEPAIESNNTNQED
jgi:hypothetical protein